MINFQRLYRPALLSLLPFLLVACPSAEPSEQRATASALEEKGLSLAAGTPACVNSPEPQGHALVAFETNHGDKTRVDLFDTDVAQELVVARWQSQEAKDTEAPVWAVATHLLVTLQPGASPAQVKAAASAAFGEELDLVPSRIPNVYRLGVFHNADAARALGRSGKLLNAIGLLRPLSGVRHVEPDYLLLVDATPNDHDFGGQDDLKRIGAEAAWDHQKGSKNIRVAVIDTGIDPDHPDLKANIAKDSNGDFIWQDLVNGKAKPYDDHRHGTLCAGVIGAEGDNGTGIAGVNWHVSLVPIKAFDKRGCAPSSTAAAAIDVAIENHVAVISASWGGFVGPNATVLQDAIDRADWAGILLVASAGNGNQNLNTTQYLPASSTSRNVISVGSATDSDGKAPDSGFGSRRVHLSAPGKNVLSTLPTTLPIAGIKSDPYGRIGGTSAAAAFVSGACALVKAQHGGSLDYLGIRNLILSATESKPGLAGASCTEGRLNVANAIKKQNLRTVSCP